jgi:hypothetical protein
VNIKQKTAIGAQRAKHIWRIREVMSDNGMQSFSALGAKLGLTAESVRRTAHGTLHTYKVLDWLRAHGLPEEYVCDPRNI